MKSMRIINKYKNAKLVKIKTQINNVISKSKSDINYSANRKLFSTNSQSSQVQVSKNVSNPIDIGINMNDTSIENLKVNDKINDFTVVSNEFFPVFNLYGLSLEHPSGMRLYHLNSKYDDNKTMGYHFKTPAFDSTGVFHILEHLTLAGSKYYKERDPFFKMIRRSLKTYMNAWTGQDFTMYPFATRNLEDYFNLREVYYNSVFHPRLNYLDFLQEGWRVEVLKHNIETNDNFKNNLVFNGVVMNEMKGAMSNPETHYLQSMYKILFEGTAYEHNSGGEPLEIPKLTYKNILDTHSKYYNFSNCKVFTYGNQGIAKDSEYFSRKILNANYKKIDTSFTEIPNMKKFMQPKFQTEYYQLDLAEEKELLDREKQLKSNRIDVKEYGKIETVEDNKIPNETWKYSISYYTNNCVNEKDEQDNSYTTFKLSILSLLLTEGPNAPFYKEFISKKLAPAYIHGYGYDHNNKFSVFTIGFMNFPGNEQSLSNLERNIIKTLNDTFKNGFDRKLIDEVLHMVEYDNVKPREDFGIDFFQKSCSFMTHGNDVYSALRLPSFLERIKKELLTNPNLFQDLIKKYLLDNNHRVHLTMKPKRDVAILKNKFENDLLLKLESELTPEKLTKINEDNSNLIAYQDSEHQLNTDNLLESSNKTDIIEKYDYIQNNSEKNLTKVNLPTLELNAIPRKIENVRFLKLKTAFDVPLYFFPQPTNNLSFIRIKANIKELPSKYKSLTSLYSNLFPLLGTKKSSYEEFQNKINTVSSGVGVGLKTDIVKNSENEYNEQIIYEFSFLDSNVDLAMNYFTELISQPNFFDINNISNLISQKSVELANNIVENSFLYAEEEAISGLKQNKFNYNLYKQDLNTMKLGSEMIKCSDPKLILNSILEDLMTMHYLLLMKDNIEVCYHGSKEMLKLIESKYSLLLNSIKNENPVFFREIKSEIKKEDHSNKILSSESVINISEYLKINNLSTIEAAASLISSNSNDSSLVPVQIKNDVNLLEEIKKVDSKSVSKTLENNEFNLKFKKLIIKTPSQVTNCVEAFLVPYFNHKDISALVIAANIMSQTLHKEIREKGGAYGSGIKFKSGTAIFFSYRDPNPDKTFHHFEQAIIKVSKNKFSDADLKEAKLVVFSQVDNVQSPQNKGLEIFLSNITKEEMETYRNNLLDCTREDVVNATKKYFCSQLELNTTSRVVCGNISEEGTNEIDDYFKSEGWDFLNSLNFLSDDYFEEKEN